MPPPVLKAWTHCARSVRAVTIDAVVCDEQLCAGSDCALVSLMRIARLQWLSADRESRTEVFRMIDDAETVSSIRSDLSRARLIARARSKDSDRNREQFDCLHDVAPLQRKDEQVSAPARPS